MLISISTNIPDIELDLIEDQVLLFPGGVFDQNLMIFGVDMSSSTKIDSREKDILILVKGPSQGSEHALSAEKMYSINFTEHNKKSCLSLLYNGANSYLFVNGKEIHKFKAKDSEIVATPLCLENISKDCTVDNMKKDWIKWVCLLFQIILLLYHTCIMHMICYGYK